MTDRIQRVVATDRSRACTRDKTRFAMNIAAIENCNIKTFNCPNPAVNIEQRFAVKASAKRHSRNICQAILGQLLPEPSLKKDKRRNLKAKPDVTILQ